MDRSDTIARVCQEILNGEFAEAAKIARKEYPFEPMLPQPMPLSNITCPQCGTQSQVERV